MALERLWTLIGATSQLTTCDLSEWDQSAEFTVQVKAGEHVILVETFPTRERALDCAAEMHQELIERGWTLLP